MKKFFTQTSIVLAIECGLVFATSQPVPQANAATVSNNAWVSSTTSSVSAMNR